MSTAAVAQVGAFRRQLDEVRALNVLKSYSRWEENSTNDDEYAYLRSRKLGNGLLVRHLSSLLFWHLFASVPKHFFDQMLSVVDAKDWILRSEPVLADREWTKRYSSEPWYYVFAK